MSPVEKEVAELRGRVAWLEILVDYLAQARAPQLFGPAVEEAHQKVHQKADIGHLMYARRQRGGT